MNDTKNHKLSLFRTRFLCCVCIGCLVGGDLQNALADNRDKALAEALFREAKRLMDAKNYTEACPKLAESHRLDPASGTLLNLALCYRGEGKTASAWSTLQDVATMSRKDGRSDRENRARDLIRELEPTLSSLEVQVQGASDTLRVEVQIDGIPLPKAAWGVSVPTDPGKHTIKATAPGYSSWTTEVTLGDNADKKTVRVPNLVPVPQAASSTPNTSPSASSAAPQPSAMASAVPTTTNPANTSSRRYVAYGTLGLGTIATGVGVFFGVRALTKQSEADALCDQSRCANKTAVDLSKEATSSANVANVSIAVGLIGLGVGTYLFLTSSPSGSASKESAEPAAKKPFTWRMNGIAQPGQGSLTVEGVF